MPALKVKFTPVDSKPKKKGGGLKGSKYLPIIREFLESGHQMVRVDGTDKEPDNLVKQLKKTLRRKRIDGIHVYVYNRKVYLEKIRVL